MAAVQVRYIVNDVQMGPLYHLTTEHDREAARARNLSTDPTCARMRNQDLVDGQHRNETGRIDYFTTDYFHRPEDLAREMRAVRFDEVTVLGVEGPGWLVGDFERRCSDVTMRGDMLAVARAVEAEPSIIGASAHLLGIGRKTGS